MSNLEYANAYTEVLEILKHISKEEYNKVPQNKIKFYEINSNKNYTFSYNPNKTLEEQNVSKRARAVIAILFRDYWATPEQRDKILEKERYDTQKNEEEKRIKYNVDKLFKKN